MTTSERLIEREARDKSLPETHSLNLTKSTAVSKGVGYETANDPLELRRECGSDRRAFVPNSIRPHAQLRT